jgi:hypothetical protein
VRLEDVREAVREIKAKVEMQTLAITRAELRELMRLQRSLRWDWPAVFSVNSEREIWPFKRYGLTGGREREELRNVSKILDAVADKYLSIKSGGGRFFVDEKGAFYKDRQARQIKFVCFRVSK